MLRRREHQQMLVGLLFPDDPEAVILKSLQQEQTPKYKVSFIP